jgi:DNA invertase Pin-like site-specific DNA recombinase
MTDYGYARVSTRDQDPQLQINALEAAGCWPIVKEHASGVAKKRPVLDEVLAQLRPGDTFTVWKLDRLGRSVVFLAETIDGMAARGVTFRSLTDGINTSSSTPGGQLQRDMLAAFAAFERSLIRERTLAGKARMKAEGRHTGGPALFGWEADHVTVDEAEAGALRFVAELILDHGLNLSQVVEILNTDPARYPRPRRGGRWRVTSLRRVLENPTTASIVDRFDKLQGVINHGPGRGAGGGRPAQHLLSGILRCGRDDCGQPLYAASKTGRTGVPQLVYRCKATAGSGGRFAGCGQTSVSMSRADVWAEEMFVAAVAAPEFTEALNRRQAELLAGDATAEELDAWREELGELEQVMPTRFAPPDAKERHARLRRLVDQATAQLMTRPDLQALLDLPRSEARLRARWAGWSVAERRAWLRRLVEFVTVRPATAPGRRSVVEERFAPVWSI